MGAIFHEHEFVFPEGNVVLTWDEGDKLEFGYEIEVTHYPPEDVDASPETLLHYSFGYEWFSQGFWLDWGVYIFDLLKHAESHEYPETQLAGVLEHLSLYDCEYMYLHPDHYEDPERRDKHCVDLIDIYNIIQDMRNDLSTVKALS